MLNSLKKITDKVKQLYDQHGKILDYLFQHYWKDTRPSKIKEETSVTDFNDFFDSLSSPTTTITSEKKKLSEKFKLDYQDWYSSCCALLERNYNKERTSEFKSEYENNIKKTISANYITRDTEYGFVDSFKHQASILNALPQYLKHRLSDIELTVASILMDDELLEAEYLIKKGFIRAAGALAGVVLERHLKMRCDKNEPKLKYPKNATISKLNDIQKDNNLLDISDWRNIQRLGDIRNKCDHDKKVEPKKEEVADLISKVKEMIHCY
ncbi:hypothetical protein C5S31_02370 [ANME-1 cluster archaeon GoMg2]|nr:hypothetical protein [ANME-1 cluster archaeon GoMg2]